MEIKNRFLMKPGVVNKNGRTYPEHVFLQLLAVDLIDKNDRA